MHANETHQHHPSHGPKERRNQPSSVLRIKVRMRMGELRELISGVDANKGDAEIGQLIMQQCLRGKYHAAIADYQQDHDFPRNVKRLETIKEI